jgi:hypothetical protein
LPYDVGVKRFEEKSPDCVVDAALMTFESALLGLYRSIDERRAWRENDERRAWREN